MCRSPPREPSSAAAYLPNARTVMVEGTGHMTHVDRPEAWLDALDAFLSEP
ncbi:alpha/beta fold hydrolase [Nocardiopsis sp. B62]|nr:hypothetical protein [Nocardiopsis sp. B62]MBQ1083288.1 hypothetical protein [Nocardiopsis sp. B62]